MIKVEIRTTQNKYPVYLRQGILPLTGRFLRGCFSPCPVLLITDRNVFGHYGEICRRSLLREGFKPLIAVMEGGEKDKSLKSACRLYSFALEEGLDRKSVVLALGGGVTGDLAGFVAATYMRGIPFIQVPTTLLAMVDSSVGGKVAVNHPRGKNMIGSFYQPSLVLADPAALKTLPQREFMAGLAELIKYGIILDKALFRQFEHFAGTCEKQPPKGKESIFLQLNNTFTLLKFIAKAVLIKGRVVALDERENGLRRVLNFGHTFGHALEMATAYEYYLHGEAVAVGMIAATRLAARLKILGEKTAERILALLFCLNPPPPPPGMTAESVLNALLADKKKEGRELVFILPSAIGETVVCKSPPMEDLAAVVNEYLKNY